MLAPDGHEYETVKDRLLGRPKDNPRNNWVEILRENGADEAYIRAWYRAFDASPTSDYRNRHRDATVACAHLPRRSRTSGTSLPAPLP